jgi:hypothetical protein
VRDGVALDGLGDDLRAVVDSLTRGCRPPAIRRGPDGVRLTTRGRELLALGSIAMQRQWHAFERVRVVGARTVAALALVAEAPRTTADLGLGLVLRLRRAAYLDRTADGRWTLTPRGAEVARTGVSVTRETRIRTVRIGGG